MIIIRPRGCPVCYTTYLCIRYDCRLFIQQVTVRMIVGIMGYKVWLIKLNDAHDKQAR